MYSLKPIISEFDVEKPKNMYVIKEINPREERQDKFLANLQTSLQVGKVIFFPLHIDENICNKIVIFLIGMQ